MWKERPSTVTVVGQATLLAGVVTPRVRYAYVEATLKVEPGGYLPVRARSKPVLGLFATASTSPLGTSTATTAPGTVRSASARACSAARCTRGDRVVSTSAPGFGSAEKSVRSELVTTARPAVPARVASYCRCSPLSPARSPAA